MPYGRKGFLFGVLLAVLVAGCTAHGPVKPSWSYSAFKEVPFDPYPGMDFQGHDGQLTPQELSGRIVWNLWTGDNAGFWNWLVQHGFGTTDLLKVVASPRNERFQTYGVINQPGYQRPAAPDENGLYLDVARDAKYDFDSKIDLATYGRSSGVMGLRLFPNPKFDKAKWKPQEYWSNPNYYNNPKLERPYVVGMACAFCHTGPDPVNPPADPNEPEFANLSDYVGQHYMKVWEVFGHDLQSDNFVKQLLMTNPAGTLDTSFIATDYLNNPGTMNGVYVMKGRLTAAYPEKVTGGALALKNLQLDAQGNEATPRVLKEGADSVGIYGALSRVYLNIGEYWEEWTRHFNPLVGISQQSPIRVVDAQKNSPHWNWSESHSPALAAYFIRVTQPHKLAAAPGGAKYLTTDKATLDRGKRVFAQSCAGCHSSKQPPAGVDPASPEGVAWFQQAVQKDDFLDDNFLGSEVRYPVTLIRTNATRAVARNGLRDHVWDNFSSETYKTLPAVGSIQVWDPFTGQDTPWKVPGNGRGYYRPPSLVSIWSSAPFFHNNALGKHVHGVSVAARMEAFDDAVNKLLWPENRDGAKSIWRTTEESWLQLPESYLDSKLLRRKLRSHLQTDPRTGARSFAFGPIPKGTPVNLLSNTDLELSGLGKGFDLAGFLLKTVGVLKDVKKKGLTGDAATQELMKLVPDLYKLNACPDFIEDKGHYFGTDLPDGDKRALIEYLKTM
jgi:cytochrome c5